MAPQASSWKGSAALELACIAKIKWGTKSSGGRCQHFVNTVKKKNLWFYLIIYCNTKTIDSTDQISGEFGNTFKLWSSKVFMWFIIFVLTSAHVFTAFHFFYDSKRCTLGLIPKTSSVQRIKDIKVVFFFSLSSLKKSILSIVNMVIKQSMPGAGSGAFTETKDNFFVLLITRENGYSIWSEIQKRFAGRRTSCNSEQSQ